MRKLTFLGGDRPTVGLVVPTGFYSFNLDGLAIYLSLAALHIARATDTPLTITQQLGLLAVMLLISKGAAGGGVHRADRDPVHPRHVPVAGIMLIFGIDKVKSVCRARSTATATPSPRW